MADFNASRPGVLGARPYAESQPLARWKDAIRDVPDLRWEKVRRIREAILRGTYDDEAILDRVLDRFENEFGVLCRRRATDV